MWIKWEQCITELKPNWHWFVYVSLNTFILTDSDRIRIQEYESRNTLSIDGINEQTRVSKEAYSSLNCSGSQGKNHQVKFDHRFSYIGP
jgi:hypothetical protein